MKISQSEVDAYMICKRKWWYAFNERIERKQKGDALTRGIAGHDIFEAFFKSLAYLNDQGTPNAFDKALQVANDRVTTLVQDNPSDMAMTGQAWVLFKTFLLHYRTRIETWKIIAVEQEQTITINNHVEYPFTPDLVIQEGPYKCLLDYKFTYNFYTATEMKLLGQLPKYVAALRVDGQDISKAYYAQLRYRELKNPDPTKIVRMESIPLSQKRLITTWRQQSFTAQEIAEFRASKPTIEQAHPILSKSVCGFCSFKALCEAEINGENVSAVRAIEFQPSTYGYSESVAKEA